LVVLVPPLSQYWFFGGVSPSYLTVLVLWWC